VYPFDYWFAESIVLAGFLPLASLIHTVLDDAFSPS